MKKHYKNLVLLFAFTLWAGYIHAQITVDATAGTPSGSYATLKDAFDAINNGTHQGAIDIRVHANTTETASASLDSSGNGTGSSYTSILIRPADTATVPKIINCSVGALAIINLNGADNVTFDGRPLSAGTNSFLRINSTANVPASFNIRLLNGAQGNTFTYLTSLCTLNPGATTVVHMLLTAGTSTTPCSNNTIQYCQLTGGSQGIQFGGSATITTINTIIYRNIIENFRNIGLLLSNGITSLTVDSNIIRHTATFGSIETATIYGMDMNFLISSSTINITRNTILDLNLSAGISTSGINGIRIFPQTTTVTGANVNIYNNAISLTRANTTITGNQVFQGLRYSGAAPANVNVINNAIRIGGSTTVAAAGVINSIAIFKANTAATSSYVARNNVIINERVTTSGFCAASWVSSIAGTMNVNYNTYYTSPTDYTALWTNGTNSSIYQAIGNYRAGALVAPNEQNSNFDFVNFVSSSNLAPAGTSINNYAVMSCPRSASVLTDISGSARGTLTYRGILQSTPFTNLKDASVKEVYTLGKLPIPYANPHIIRANVQNTGIDTLFNQLVRANVTGTNTFADSVIIDTILPGQNRYATFSNYSYINTGNCIVTVSVPPDSTNTNNSKIFNQIITTGTYAYAEPTLPSIGGVGFNGVGGDFIAKFPYTGSNNINQVGVNFFAGGQPYQILIYSMINDTPGTLIWSSSTLTSSAGINTISVNPVVPVSGTFFVGVRQTGTTNVSFGYQAEDPIRNGVFYYKATTAANWADFASTNSAFRFMVEPRLQIADDIGVQSVSSPCNVVVLNSPVIFPRVRVYNYGLNGYSTATVKYSITGPTSSSGTTVFPSVSLSSNTSVDLTLSSSFNPNTIGTYTMKVWTELASDLEKNNDTATYVFTVVNNNTFTNSGNHLVLNGTNQSVTIPSSSSLDFSASMLTVEGWVNPGSTGFKYIMSREQSAGTSQFDLYMNPLGNIVFKLTTISGTDSIISAQTIPLLSYSHIAGVYNGTEMRLYINGNLTGTKSLFGTFMSTTINPLYLGQAFFGGTSFWNGNLDEIKIWDTARTEQQIKLGIHTRTNNFASAALKGYWRMDETGGAYIADAAGNCNNGILNAAPTFATSKVTLGLPIVASQTVTTSGPTAFTAAGVTLNAFNQSGSNEYYIHRFGLAPIGTSPVTSPGGIINVSNNTWFIYRYGTGTMDSSIVDFTVGSGVPSLPVLTDIKLFSREVGSDGNWIKLRDEANSMSFATQRVSMVITPVEFNKQFALGANSSALPVKLIYFNGKRNNADVELTWITASETENAGFIVERSVDGKVFEKVSYVEGKGNITQTSTYSLSDANAFANANAKTLYYRLVQTDFSGEETISQVVSVSANTDEETITALYPNPFNNELTFTIDSKVISTAKILVMDITGKKVVELTQTITTGMNTIETAQLSQLTKGVYMVQLSVNGQLTTHKLVKQ